MSIEFAELALRQFTLDGSPVEIEDFITSNADSFDSGDVEDIRLLDVGQSLEYGGGAAAEFKLMRIA